jgi:hypothetical protein
MGFFDAKDAKDAKKGEGRKNASGLEQVVIPTFSGMTIDG